MNLCRAPGPGGPRARADARRAPAGVDHRRAPLYSRVRRRAARAASPTAGRGKRARAQDLRVAEGERALARGDAARALELADAAVAARPAGVAARLLAARAHAAREEYEASWAQLDAVLTASPRNVDALALMGEVSGQLAAATFDRLNTEAPGSARVQQLQGETLEAQERRSEAEAAYEAAVKLDPNLLEAVLALAKLKRIRLACDDAMPLYERAERIRPTFDAAYGLGFCLASMQEDAKAVEHFRHAVARDPRAAVGWSGLGNSLVKTGQAAEGIAALKRALSIEPRMTDGWYMLGLAYQAANEPALSKDAFARAEALRVGAKP